MASTSSSESNIDNISPSNWEDANQTLLQNINLYKTQLDEVSAAIESASEEDKVQLQELQLNLISILELTLSQLDQSQINNDKRSTTASQKPSAEISSKDKIDEEFEKFKLEIAKLDENEKQEKEENSTINKLTDFESNLNELEGQNVRAPFMEKWGGFSYHNAVILSLVQEQESVINYENPQVLVLFSQPTSVSMLPCRFFLEGRCKFDSEKCKFSHGDKVAVEDLKEYNEPDRNNIVSGSNVLALHEDQDIWHRGKVEDVLENRAGFSFNCFVCGNVFEVPLELMFPFYADEEEETSPKEDSLVCINGKRRDESSYREEEEEKEEEEDTVFVPSDVWLKNSLSTKLGEWEKYTNGIGSKLMAKMGYIVGTGLGPKGDGRVDPVAAYVYPQGVSLDHCMHLRQASNGENLLQVEKRLLNEQKKEEEKKKQQQNYLNSRTSVFDIINTKLGSHSQDKTSPSEEGSGASIDVSKSSLKKNTAKELNKKNFQLSSNIAKLKEEITILNRSRNRQSRDAATTKAIDNKLQEKMQQLSSLQKAAEQIDSEQQCRKNIQKLCTF